MSEAEKKRRLDYKQNRNKWMLIQGIALIVVFLLTIGFTVTYFRLNQTYYIGYTEEGNVTHDVLLKENDFYDSLWITEDQAYVASLIDILFADFSYDLAMDTDNVSFEYSYHIDAQLEIIDNDTDTAIFNPTYPLVPRTTKTQNAPKLSIREQVQIDYDEYNELASTFIETYGLSDVSGLLNVKMYVEVDGASSSFETGSKNHYIVELHVPLTGKTVNAEVVSTVPVGENRVLACEKGSIKDVFKVLSIVFASLLLVLLVLFVSFILLTRNTDINYEIKVKRIVSSYRSYIQQIGNHFGTDGYQILTVKTFTEMLGIRDTIQSPILMTENEDKTCTQFLIPTNTKILYVFEVKVDDYDDLYGTGITDEELDEEEETPEEVTEEVILIDDSVSEEDIVEAMEMPDVDLKTLEYEDVIDPAFEGTAEEPGVEVIGVVWPEKAHKNRVYRYDPNGETLEDGDVVLVPTHDTGRDREVIRKAAVAHGNHRVDPALLKHPLKKIVGVVRRKAEELLTPKDDGNEGMGDSGSTPGGSL